MKTKYYKNYIIVSLASFTGVLHAQKIEAFGGVTPPVSMNSKSGEFTDNDKDGFDDLWYQAFAIGAEPLKAADDPDRDGISNLD